MYIVCPSIFPKEGDSYRVHFPDLEDLTCEGNLIDLMETAKRYNVNFSKVLQKS